MSRPTDEAEASPDSDTSRPPSTPPTVDTTLLTATSRDDFTVELIASMTHIFKQELQTVKQELQTALGENLISMKSELQVVKAELTVSITSIQAEVGALLRTVAGVEAALSACSDDIVALQTKVEKMSAEMIKLDDRCEVLESFTRRNSIRVVGIGEDSPAAASTETVAALLKEAFKLQEDPLLDRWHRTWKPKPGPGEPPRPIVVRLHYHEDCVAILKQARTLRRIKIQDMTISVFPDYTAKTARARAAFKDVRRQLYELKLPGLRFGLVFPACLKVSYNGDQKEFKSATDAEAYIKTLAK